MKRIIFDIDNTLLDTTADCFRAYDKFIAFNKLNLTSKQIYDSLDDSYTDYSFKGLSKKLSEKLKMDFDEKLCISLQEFYAQESTILDSDVTSVFERISKQYELVALTNWFTTVQKERLKKAGLLGFFKEVYGGDIISPKPDKQAYITACGNNQPYECLMIGDNLDYDVKYPIKYGMKAIYYNKNKLYTKYKSIDKISELERILEEEK